MPEIVVEQGFNAHHNRYEARVSSVESATFPDQASMEEWIAAMKEKTSPPAEGAENLSNLSEMNKSLRKRADKLETENQLLKEHNKDMTARVEEMTTQIDELRREVKDAKAERDDALSIKKERGRTRK